MKAIGDMCWTYRAQSDDNSKVCVRRESYVEGIDNGFAFDVGYSKTSSIAVSYIKGTQIARSALALFSRYRLSLAAVFLRFFHDRLRSPRCSQNHF